MGGTRTNVTVLSVKSPVTSIRTGPQQLTTFLSNTLPATKFLLFLVICEDLRCSRLTRSRAPPRTQVRVYCTSMLCHFPFPRGSELQPSSRVQP